MLAEDRKEIIVLTTVIVVLLVLWLLGIVTSYTLGGLVHILLVVVIVIPSMTKVALGIGGSYGRGAMVCRSGKTFKGPWGAPAMYALEGGSIGLQLGGESTDVVFLVMNRRGVDALLNSKVKLGGNA